MRGDDEGMKDETEDDGFVTVHPAPVAPQPAPDACSFPACRCHYEPGKPRCETAPDYTEPPLPAEGRGIMQARIDALEAENANLLRALQGQPTPAAMTPEMEALVAAADRYDRANDAYDEDNAEAMKEWRAARMEIKAALAALRAGDQQ